VLQFTSPTSNPTIELNQAGTASIPLTVNQSVTWSLQTVTGFGTPPAGASVSPTTGSSTTFAFTSPLLRCSGQTVQVEVVATSNSTPPQSTELPVSIAQSPPCLAQQFQGESFSSCPAAGTVFNVLPAGALGQVGVFFNQQTIAVGSSGNVPFGVPPFVWILTGAPPAGLSLSPGADTTSMILSGTPTSAGCSSFQLQVTDATGGVSCDPTITTSCVPTTFYIAIIPPALKVLTPAYPDSFDGIPYAPMSIVASGGTPPYTWVQSGSSTLPPGLGLSTSGSNSNYVVVSGTPNLGDNLNSNGAAGAGNTGEYPTQLLINDSQLPYPAVGVANLPGLQDYLPAPACSSSPANPQILQPTGASGNGGILGDGGVPVDNYLQGAYAFQLRGFDAQQPTVIAGSITLDGNGNVTAGEEDITQGASSQALAVTGGAYTVGVVSSAGPIGFSRGCVTLTTSAGTQTFDFTLGGCTNQYSESGATTTSDAACGMKQNGNQNVAAGMFTTGRIIESDDGSGKSAQLSGFLRAQNTSTFSGGLSGPFAFGLGGWDSALGHYAVAGSVQATSGTLASAAADIDDAGSLSSQLTGGSGTLGAADSNGRIAGTLTLGQTTLDLALYLVSSGEAIVVTTDPLSASDPLLGGEALATANSFSPASLQNSHMLAMGGVASSGPDVSIGVLTFDGVGSVKGTVYEDQAGTLGTTAVAGAYFVDGTTGRTTFAVPQNGTLGAHIFVAYLVPPPANLTSASCNIPASCVTAFLVGIDNTAQDGVLEFQTASPTPPPFTNRYVVGDFAYATVENLDSMATSFEGDVYATPSSSGVTNGSLGTAGLPFFQDSSYGCLLSTCPFFVPGDTFTGAYTVSTNGTGTFGGGTTVSVGNGNVIFSVDESPVNLHPSIIVAEQ
jgi:hypothetical protein